MTVELDYRARVDAMSPVERIRRAEALFAWSRDYLARSILASAGPMPDGDLTWEIAHRLYGTEPAVRNLLAEARIRATR